MAKHVWISPSFQTDEFLKGLYSEYTEGIPDSSPLYILWQFKFLK